MIEHKLAPILRAIADGKQIQMWGAKGHSELGWFDIPNPPQNIYLVGEAKYRIKPDPKKYRVALLTYGTETIDKKDDEQYIESFATFVRWLTDWVEYD